MSWVAVAVGGMQLVSGFQQGESIRANAQFKSQIDDMNMKYAEADAYNAEKEGISESARYQTNVEGTIGAQRVAYAAKGVDVNFGTAKDMQTQTRLQGLINVLDIQKAGREKAQGFLNQARNYGLQSSFTKQQGALDSGAATATGIFQGATTALSGYNKRG